MSKTVYVYSTLAADTAYTSWNKGGGDVPLEGESITIKGGSGVANKNFITPQGVVTSITEDQLVILEQNPVFQKHKEKGFIRYSHAKTEPEHATRDMTKRDVSAPKTPEDYDENKPGAKLHESSKRKK